MLNDPLYNHVVFGPAKGKGGVIGKSDEQLIQDLIAIHNAENWLGMDGDSELSMFNKDASAASSAQASTATSTTPPGSNASNESDEAKKDSKALMNGDDDKASDDSGAGSSLANGDVTSNEDPSSAQGSSSSSAQWTFDPSNPSSSLSGNPSVPRNCTITRPPPITKPGHEPVVLRPPLETEPGEGATEQDGELLSRHREYRYQPERMTWDPHCYECKVRYRDPKPRDLVMYLHAWRYKVGALKV